MELTKTLRGFARAEFTDRNGQQCSLQKSSLATEDAIWLGVNDANPQIMATDATIGWVPYPIPEQVLLATRMHLTREQVADLLPALQRFVETGELS